jgi:hypothetical protein
MYTAPKVELKQGMQKPKLSARASSEPPNLDEIAVDNDFAVITTKKKQRKTKMKPYQKPPVNTALPLLRVMFLLA